VRSWKKENVIRAVKKGESMAGRYAHSKDTSYVKCAIIGVEAHNAPYAKKNRF
jgi:hypothetical protein